ncbi:hypothetical protein [Komagataeibacter sp. NFXK3]
MSARNGSFRERVANWSYQHIAWNIPLRIRDPRRHYVQLHAIKRFLPGTIIEDCRYRPAIILENDQGDPDMLGYVRRELRVNAPCSTAALKNSGQTMLLKSQSR